MLVQVILAKFTFALIHSITSQKEFQRDTLTRMCALCAEISSLSKSEKKGSSKTPFSWPVRTCELSLSWLQTVQFFSIKLSIRLHFIQGTMNSASGDGVLWARRKHALTATKRSISNGCFQHLGKSPTWCTAASWTGWGGWYAGSLW